MEKELARLRQLIEQLIRALERQRNENRRLQRRLTASQAELEQAKQRLHDLQHKIRSLDVR